MKWFKRLLVFVAIAAYAIYTIIEDKKLFNYFENDIIKFVFGLVPFSLNGIINSGKSLFGIKKKTYQDKIIQYARENHFRKIIVGHNHQAEERHVRGEASQGAGKGCL